MRYVSADGKPPYDGRTGCSTDHTDFLVDTLWHDPSVRGPCAIKRCAGTFQIRRARLVDRASNISSSRLISFNEMQGETDGQEKMVVRLPERPSPRCRSGLGEGRRVW